MDFYMKLPRNGKEFILFLLIISIISVNIIAPLITGFELGFSFSMWKNTLKLLPFIWCAVVALVLATHKLADFFVKKIVDKDDSFNAHIIVNILCSVVILSIFLTVIGTWIGSKSLSLEPIYKFFHKWPRNFAISFFVELLIAQPIARFCMLLLHKHVEEKQ